LRELSTSTNTNDTERAKSIKAAIMRSTILANNTPRRNFANREDVILHDVKYNLSNLKTEMTVTMKDGGGKMFAFDLQSATITLKNFA